MDARHPIVLAAFSAVAVLVLANTVFGQDALKAAVGARENWHAHVDLLINAVVAGLLIGGLYAAVTIGLSIAFGMLDVVNIAHPASFCSDRSLLFGSMMRSGSIPSLPVSCCRRSCHRRAFC